MHENVEFLGLIACRQPSQLQQDFGNRNYLGYMGARCKRVDASMTHNAEVVGKPFTYLRIKTTDIVDDDACPISPH
jgi:hypothetical protein